MVKIDFLVWLTHQPLVPQIMLFYISVGFILSLFGIAKLIRWVVITPLSMVIFCILATEYKNINTLKTLKHWVIETFLVMPIGTFTALGEETAVEGYKNMIWVYPYYIMSTERYYDKYGE